MVAGMAWTEEEDLVVVGATTGQAHVFPLDAFLEGGGDGGSRASPTSAAARVLTLGADAARDGVAAVAFWGDGLVAMTKCGALVALDGFADPRVELLQSPLTGLASAGPLPSPPPSSSLPNAAASSASLFTTTTAPPLAVIPPAASPTGSPRAITASGRDIVVCDARSGSGGGSSKMTKATMGAAVAAIAVSPCGGFVAAADRDARLVVWSSDFSKALSEFATQAATPPDALAWCGSDSVVMLWKAAVAAAGGGSSGSGAGDFAPSLSSSSTGTPFAAADHSSESPSSSPSPSPRSLLLMVGPFGDWVKYDAAGVAALSTEPDGLRILSSSKSDLLRRVPDELADALRPGSAAPSAALRDARRALDGVGGFGGFGAGGGGAAFCGLGATATTAGGSLGALRALRRRALPGAAVAAADAARSAVKASTQEELLKAAALGVAFALGGGTATEDEEEEEEEDDDDDEKGEDEGEEGGGGGDGDGGEGSQKTRRRKKTSTTRALATRAAAAAVAAAISEIRVLRAAGEAVGPRSSASSSSSSSSPSPSLSPPGPALALTSRQLELLGTSSLVGRLARRGHHLLALRAARALGCPSAASAGVAAHWAAAVISSPEAAGESDEALARKIRSQMEQLAVLGSGGGGGGASGGREATKSNRGVRYGALAAVAAAAGRRALAAALLEAEPVPRERVPLLLRLGDGARALDAALAASDPDLIAAVLLRPTLLLVGGGGVGGGGGGGADGEAAANAAKLVQKARASPAARAVLARAALDAAEAARVGDGSGSGGGNLLLSCLSSQSSTSTLSPELKAVERVLGPSPAASLAAEMALSAAAGAAASAVAARREGRGRAERAAGEAAARALDAAAEAFSRSGSTSSCSLTAAASSSHPSANFDSAFYASAASEGASLRRLQASLEASTGHAMLVGLSPSETLAACLRVEGGGGGGGGGRSGSTAAPPPSSDAAAADAAARRVRAELRLSDRRWAWARLRSKVEARDWGGVEAMAASDATALSGGVGRGGAKGGGSSSRARGSSSSTPAAITLPTPILVDVARMCRRGGAPEAAVLRLFERLPEDAAKVEALAASGLRREAARVAARLGAIGGAGGGSGGGAGGSGQNAEDLLGRLQQGVLSLGRGLVGGGSR